MSASRAAVIHAPMQAASSKAVNAAQERVVSQEQGHQDDPLSQVSRKANVEPVQASLLKPESARGQHLATSPLRGTRGRVIVPGSSPGAFLPRGQTKMGNPVKHPRREKAKACLTQPEAQLKPRDHSTVPDIRRTIRVAAPARSGIANPAKPTSAPDACRGSRAQRPALLRCLSRQTFDARGIECHGTAKSKMAPC
jgi:hypothetical protein